MKQKTRFVFALGGVVCFCLSLAWLISGTESLSITIGLGAFGLMMFHVVLMNVHPVKVPVVMLHSVVGFREDRPENFSIWCAPGQFEGYLKYLKKRGYHTVTLAQLYGHLGGHPGGHSHGGGELPEKPIVLTFDDGYLDNWVYVAPLLRKYGFTGTVFMPTDFIQPGQTPRLSVEDVWAGRLREEQLECYGYLNCAELRLLSQEGVLDVQCHGRTHTWRPTTSRVVGFHNPGLKLRDLRWMWWNRHPERKPHWFEQISHEEIPWGAPVYENDLALSGRIVTPDPLLEKRLVEFVAGRGGREFFSEKNWEQQLREQVDEFPQEPAARESESDFIQRLRGELKGSRETLEKITGKPVHFMCWPNGGTCPEAFALLEECGYLAATLPSRNRQPRNHRGTDPGHIGRVSGSSFFRGTQKVWPWVLSFALKVERNRGNGYMEFPIKAIWLYRQFVKPSGGRPPGAED